jgi:hypothetical protein
MDRTRPSSELEWLLNAKEASKQLKIEYDGEIQTLTLELQSKTKEFNLEKEQYEYTISMLEDKLKKANEANEEAHQIIDMWRSRDVSEVEQLRAGISRDFQSIMCPPHSTTSLLDGTVLITCKDNGVQLKARIARFEDFNQIAQQLTAEVHVSKSSYHKTKNPQIYFQLFID